MCECDCIICFYVCVLVCVCLCVFLDECIIACVWAGVCMCILVGISGSEYFVFKYSFVCLSFSALMCLRIFVSLSISHKSHFFGCLFNFTALYVCM